MQFSAASLARPALALALCGGCEPIYLGSFGSVSPETKAPTPDGSTSEGTGDGADAGDTADAGDAGEPPTAECETRSQCDDADPCNGVHDCVAGHCALVVPACTTPDEAHCNVHCDASKGDVACVVTARDGDGDGHGDAACAHSSSQPDDCNDAEPSVHEGALELCDGLDNDCDGLGDLQEGFALPGENLKVASGLLPVLASSSENTFGAAYASSGGKVTFHSFKNTGRDLLGSLQIVPMDVFSDQVVPSLAWGADSFGLVWSRNGAVRFLELSLTGPPIDPDAANNQEKLNVNPEGVSGGFANVAPVGEGEWLVFYESADPTGLWARRITSSSEQLTPVAIASGRFEQAPSVVSINGTVAAAFTRQVGSAAYVEWTLGLDGLDSTSHVNRPLATSTGLSTVSSAVIAVGPDGYGIAWSESSSFGGGLALRFATFDLEGNPLCEPFDVERPASGEAAALVPTALVATERGFVVAGYAVLTDTIAADLIEVSTQEGCRYNQRARLAEKASRNVSIARAQTGEFLVLWDAPDASDYPAVFKRSLPAELCTTPTAP